MKSLNVLFLKYILIASVLFMIPGTLASQSRGASKGIIKIGLLIPDNQSVEAKRGAELAVLEANESRALNGRELELITRSMEGPWGTGSKEAVNLIFKDNVWAIMGSHDGRNAHLVEQVTAKTRTVFLSAWASDPTLSQAFVPWYFSCVPNDNQQASALFEEIYKKRKLTKIATVTDSGYDSKSTLKSFLKESNEFGLDKPMQLSYDRNKEKEFERMIDQIRQAGATGIVLFGHPSFAFKFIDELRQKKMLQPVFGSLSLLGEDDLVDVKFENYENVVLVSSVNWSGSKGNAFMNEFQRKYSKFPGTIAAYAYDGMNLIIEAIKNSDFKREKIQEALSKMRYTGVTGTIQFDEKGNRAGGTEMIELNKGHPIKIVR